MMIYVLAAKAGVGDYLTWPINAWKNINVSRARSTYSSGQLFASDLLGYKFFSEGGKATQAEYRVTGFVRVV